MTTTTESSLHWEDRLNLEAAEAHARLTLEALEALDLRRMPKDKRDPIREMRTDAEALRTDVSRLLAALQR